jgi:hypothetical protein
MFPHLFPLGKGHYNAAAGRARGRHRNPLRRADYGKLRLRQPRFRRDPQYLFYLLRDSIERQIDAGIYSSTKIKHTKSTVLASFSELTVPAQGSTVFAHSVQT